MGEWLDDPVWRSWVTQMFKRHTQVKIVLTDDDWYGIWMRIDGDYIDLESAKELADHWNRLIDQMTDAARDIF